MSKKFTRPASANMADDEPEVPFPNISVHIANNQYVNHEIIGNVNMSWLQGIVIPFVLEPRCTLHRCPP